MATAPPLYGPLGGIYTLGDLLTRVMDDYNEPPNQKNSSRAVGHINDAIESIWMSILLATLSGLTKGPVQQVFPAGKTSLTISTVADPTTPPVCTALLGGIADPRNMQAAYCYVTDSGSTTLLSTATNIIMASNTLLVVGSPNPAFDVIGYYVFVKQSTDVQWAQQGNMIPIGTDWVEPVTGYSQYPSAPGPPRVNTTGDNIYAISRIDVQNVDMTWTNWIQTYLGGTWFTQFQHKTATTTTWVPFVYDFIEGKQLEIRPGPIDDLPGQFFYTTRPRRLRFPSSRIPFTQYAVQAFLHDFSLSRLLAGVYEWDSANWWQGSADKERARILLAIGAGNWNQNTGIKPFMR